MSIRQVSLQSGTRGHGSVTGRRAAAAAATEAPLLQLLLLLLL